MTSYAGKSRLFDRGVGRAAFTYGDSDAKRDALVERDVAKAGTGEGDAIAGAQLASRNVAAVLGPDLVIGGELELVAGLRAQAIDRLSSGRKNLADEMRPAVAADDEGRLADEALDTNWAVGRRDQRIAGNAWICCVDAIVV